MATPGIFSFTPQVAEIISDILEDDNYIKDISDILQEELKYGPDICDDLAKRILKLQEGETISDILVANGPADNRPVSQETEGKIEERMSLMRHFLMVEALTEPDGTLRQDDERVQTMSEAKNFLHEAVKRDWVKSFERKHVQVKTYEKMLDEVRTFLSGDVQKNQVPVVVFLGHGMNKTGELCFMNSQTVELNTAFDDMRQCFDDVKSKFPDSSLRIIFAQCFAHKIDDGSHAGQLHEKNGTEILYFTNSKHDCANALVEEVDRPTAGLVQIQDMGDMDFFIPNYNYYMETYLNRLVKPFEQVYGVHVDSITRDNLQMLMQGDSLSLPVPGDKQKAHTELMRQVKEQRKKIKAFLHVVCSSKVTSSRQGREAVRQAKDMLEEDCYRKTDVHVSSLKDLWNKLDNFLNTDGAGKAKHVPIVLVCAEGKRGSSGKLESILFESDTDGTECHLVKNVFAVLRLVHEKRSKVKEDSLRVAFICYEEEDQTDSATQQPGGLLYATNSLVKKTIDATNIDLNKHGQAAVGPGPRNG